ncbi:MAG: glycosyltransferase family 87 protein [bacterium]
MTNAPQTPEPGQTAEPAPPPHPVLPDYLEWVTVALCVVLVTLAAFMTVGVVFQHFKWWPRVDFTMYHAAARTALASQHLYLFHEPGGYLPGNLPYPYPPLLASLLAPLGKLSIGTAYHIWVTFIVLCLGVTAYLTARLVSELGAKRPILLATGAVLLSLILLDSNVYWGQVNIPVTALCAGAVLCGHRKKSVAAGVLLGFAAALKVLPVALAIWFLVRRDWKALGAFVTTVLAALLIIPALVGGPAWAWEMNREWLRLFWDALTKGSQGLQSGGGYVSHRKNGSLVAIFDRIFGGAGRQPMLIRLPQQMIDSMVVPLRASMAILSAVAAGILYRPRAEAYERYAWPLVASMMLICGYLINILLWDHHTVGLVFVLPVVAAACLDPRLPPGWRRPLWIGLLAAVAGLASGWFDGSRSWGLQTLCFIALWLGIVIALLSAPRPAPPPPPSPEPRPLQLELPL